MKKILLLVPSLCIGGQEKIAINTYHCLKSQYDVKFAIFQKKDIEYEYPCEVINLNIPAKSGKIAKIRNQIKRIIEVAKIRNKLNVDVVISFGNTANITNVGSKLFSCGKSISAVHGFTEVQKSVDFKNILRHSDKVICIAKAMQTELLNIYPKAKNTVVVENGYDVAEAVEKANEPLQADFPHPLIVAMGRLEEVKGFDRLIKAFAQAKKENPKMNLAILGEGCLENSLKELAEKEGVTESVRFMGHQKNPYAFLKAADLFVLSSRNEGFPNALIEALGCSCPIVSLDCQSGPREILSEVYRSSPVKGVLEEKYGVLVEHSESEERIVELLSKAIQLIINDECKQEKYRQIGMARANQFNNEVYGNKIVDIIESFT